MEPQEYIVVDNKKVAKFIDDNIGVDYELNDDDDIVVFDLSYDEHIKIRRFITSNNLWEKNNECCR